MKEYVTRVFEMPLRDLISKESRVSSNGRFDSRFRAASERLSVNKIDKDPHENISL